MNNQTNPTRVDISDLMFAAPDMLAALEKILRDAENEFEEHSKEFGTYDPSTGETEFSPYAECRDEDMHQNVENLKKIILPVLAKARGERS